MTSVLDQYGGLARLRPKTSMEEARKEANAGLHFRGDSDQPHAARTVKPSVSIVHMSVAAIQRCLQHVI